MGKQRHWVTQARHILTSHLTLPRVGRVLAILVTPPIKAMTDKTVVVTLALMVSVVLMVVDQGEPALTTPGLLAVILLGTRGTMPATPTHSRLTTLIRGTETQPLPTILLTHRTIPTVLNPELQVPHLTSQLRSHPHPLPKTGLGLSASMVGGQSVSSASKMSVNTTSGKMVPGMPPGVASVLPAQYMIGANAAAAGFPAYLAAAGLGQAPAMYGYGGHQLEDLAALQRSTLAASLPQLPSTGYYDPSSQFGGAGVPSTLASRQDQQSSFGADSNKFGAGVSDSTSSPVPTSVANAGQPTPFNALASTFAAAAPQQHPTLPPGYAYFYGGVGGMPGALQAYGGGVGGGVYPATHPGIPVPTAAGATNTSQFQNKAYGASSYGTSYDSLNLGQSNSGYGKNNYGSDNNQAKSGTSSSNAGHGYWSNALW